MFEKSGSNKHRLFAIIMLLTLFILTLALPSPVQAQPIDLSTKQMRPWSIAVDEDSVYWTNRGDGKICKVPKEGGEVVVLAERGVESAPCGIAVDNTTVYWAERTANKVCKVSKEGGTVVELATDLGGPFGIAVDDEYVYWTEHDSGRLQRIPKEGGENITLASGLAAAANGYYLLTLDDEYVYWSERSGKDAGRILKIPKEGGTVVELATKLIGWIGVAVDDEYVYWTESTDLTGGPRTYGRVCRIPKEGGTFKVLAAGQDSPVGIAVDETYVFWGEYVIPGRVRRMLKDGTGVETNMARDLSQVYGIALDDEYVYWAEDAGGVVRKIPKALLVTLDLPETIYSRSEFIINLTVENRGAETAQDVTVNITIPEDFSFIEGATVVNLGNITSGENKTVTWKIAAGDAGLTGRRDVKILIEMSGVDMKTIRREELVRLEGFKWLAFIVMVAIAALVVGGVGGLYFVSRRRAKQELAS